MLLSNLINVSDDEQVDILVDKGRIKTIGKKLPSKDLVINFRDAVVFPGLINSHDHLDFNSFPKLSNKIYNNYVEWGDDIHQQNKAVIDNVLKIPKELRIQWGMYKNLLNGITTVVNHGPKLQTGNDLITVWQDSNTLHSVQLEKRWKLELNQPFNKRSFSIHIGEGTDDSTKKEIDTLLKWNLFNRELIGIHAIAMNKEQAGKFKAIVWCPDSNYFLIGRTAEIDRLKSQTKILFGTDSTLSASWNLWEHLRLAREQKMTTDRELLDMITETPAKLWPINDCGKLKDGYRADIVVARRKASIKGLDAFYALNPEDILLVMHKGAIRLFDEEIKEQIDLKGVSKITINGRNKYVAGDLPELIEKIKAYYPGAYFPIGV